MKMEDTGLIEHYLILFYVQNLDPQNPAQFPHNISMSTFGVSKFPKYLGLDR